MSNTTIHFAVQASDGTTFSEKCKDSHAGACSMHTRIARKLGLTSGLSLRITSVTDSWNAECITPDGIIVTITKVR